MVLIRKASRDASLQKKRRDGYPASAASLAGGAPQMGHSSALQQKVRALSIWYVRLGAGAGFAI
jgi:hypothetical protein